MYFMLKSATYKLNAFVYLFGECIVFCDETSGPFYWHELTLTQYPL